MNSYVAGEYMKRQFFSIEDLCTLGNDKRSFEEQEHILQWVEKFAPLMNEYPRISRAHVFRFTSAGMQTKEFVDDTEWNTWNQLGAATYHCMLNEEPTGLLEPMQPYQLSDKKKHDAKASLAYIPQEQRTYIQGLIENNFGYQIQALNALGDFTLAPAMAQMPPITRKVVFREKRRRKDHATQPTLQQSELEPGEVEYLLQSLPPDEHFDESEDELEKELQKARKRRKSVKN